MPDLTIAKLTSVMNEYFGDVIEVTDHKDGETLSILNKKSGKMYAFTGDLEVITEMKPKHLPKDVEEKKPKKPGGGKGNKKSNKPKGGDK